MGGGQSHGGSRKPGTHAIDPLITEQPSWLRPEFNWFENQRKAILLAKIHFATDQSNLDEQDLGTIADVVDKLCRWLQNHASVNIECIGRTDPRGTDHLNDTLADSRAQAVANRLREGLDKSAKYKRWRVSINAQPEHSGGRKVKHDPLQWSEQRRVDVVVAVELLEEKDAKSARRIRADIFKNYYPDYDLWKAWKLERLIEAFEDVSDKPDWDLKIFPEETSRLLGLLKDLRERGRLDPELFADADRALGPPEHPEVIAHIYCQAQWHEHNRLAYPKFEDAFLKYRHEHPDVPYEEARKIVAGTKGQLVHH